MKIYLENQLNCKVKSMKSVSGGCINDVKIINTSVGDYFIKVNSAKHFPKMFEAEAKGLELLRKANMIRIPEVVFIGENNGYSVLVLERIHIGRKSDTFWKDFGRNLAKLHQQTNPNFGLNHSNYIGSLTQLNCHHETWTDFFIHERLEPQVKLATKKGFINTTIRNQFERLYLRLSSICPNEKSSLIHGDLWNGNFMTDENGNAVLIDPAISFSNREMDLAMTKLFGGFSDSFYKSYNENFPLENGFKKRVDIYNLYYLMVHVNLFGASYLNDVKNILKVF